MGIDLRDPNHITVDNVIMQKGSLIDFRDMNHIIIRGIICPIEDEKK